MELHTIMAGPGSHFSRRLRHLLLAARATLWLILASTASAASPLDCPTGFVNFGASLSDTGNALSVFPTLGDAELPPYGQTFFGKPSKRFSNGRLVPDFFSLAFQRPLLDPFFKATSYGYQYGINFAQAGTTSRRPNQFSFSVPPVQAKNPLYLYPTQVNQFKRFLNSVNTTESQARCSNFSSSLPVPLGTSWVSQWLFTIEAGSNDLMNELRARPPYSILSTNFQFIHETIIPLAAAAINQTVKDLYATGARKFFVFGVPAIGCSTELLTLFPDYRYNSNGSNFDIDLSRDSMGCIPEINTMAVNLNKAILDAIRALRPTLPGANIAFFDYYAANMQILTTPVVFGFNPPGYNQSFSACCGAPGRSTLNYNPAVTCGQPGSTVCANPEKYLNWDGVHYTDNFYKIISIFAVWNVFTDGSINYALQCLLDFSKFYDTFTFNQVYPSVCQTVYV